MKSNPMKTGSRASLYAMMFFLVLAMCGCSAIKYLSNDRSGDTGSLYRFPISRAEIQKFFANIRAHREDLDALYSEACYFQDQRKHKFALQNFKRILDVDPHYIKAYNGMGVSYDMIGNYQSAIDAYHEALEIDPKADYVYNNLGYAFFLQGDMDRAIDAFRKAVSLNHENKKYRNNLGLAYARKGEPDAAYAEFKSGGDEAKAHYYLGQYYYDQGSYNQALSHLTKAVEVAPTMTEARRSLEAATAMAQIVQAKALNMTETQQTDSSAPTQMAQAEQEDSRHQLVIAANSLKRQSNGMGIEARSRESQERLIEVSNGNGINHMARKVGTYLNRNGFGESRLTNASDFNFTETTIYYCDGYLQRAYQVAQSIPGYQNMEKALRLGRPETKIMVRIGKDLIPYAHIFENS
jgi:tetratricopeptide (TPR) repeat protein